MTKLPDGWTYKPLGAISDIKGGKRLPLGESLTKQDTGFIYLRVSDMTEDGVILKDLHYLPKHLASKLDRYRVKTGDLYIVVVGNTIGKCGMIPPLLNNAYLTENADRITNITADPMFLLNVLRSPIVQSTVQRLRTDNAQPKLALTRLREFKIPLPPLPEQRAIAQILGTWDEAISLVEQLISALQARKRGLMQKLLTGEVRFDGFEDEWQEVRLGDIFKKIHQGINTAADKIEYSASGIPILQTKHITTGELNFEGSRYVSQEDYLKYKEKYSPQIGHILFSNIGTIGKSLVVKSSIDFLVAWNIMIIELVEGHLSNYLNFYFQYLDKIGFFERLNAGNAAKFINKGDIENINLLISSYPEQIKISEAIEVFNSQIDIVKKYVTLLQTQKRGLMQRLLTGELRVQVE